MESKDRLAAGHSKSMDILQQEINRLRKELISVAKNQSEKVFDALFYCAALLYMVITNIVSLIDAVVCALQSIAHANDGPGAVANRLSTVLLSSHATNKVQSNSSGQSLSNSLSKSSSRDDRSYTADSSGSQYLAMPVIPLKKASTLSRSRTVQEDEDDSATHSMTMTMSMSTWNSPHSLVQSG